MNKRIAELTNVIGRLRLGQPVAPEELLSPVEKKGLDRSRRFRERLEKQRAKLESRVHAPNIRGRVIRYANGAACVVAYTADGEFKLYVSGDVFEAHCHWIWNAVVQFAMTGQVDLSDAPIQYPPEYIVDGKSAPGKFYCNNFDIGNVKITHHRLCESSRSLRNLVTNPNKLPPKVTRG